MVRKKKEPPPASREEDLALRRLHMTVKAHRDLTLRLLGIVAAAASAESPLAEAHFLSTIVGYGPGFARSVGNVAEAIAFYSLTKGFADNGKAENPQGA